MLHNFLQNLMKVLNLISQSSKPIPLTFILILSVYSFITSYGQKIKLTPEIANNLTACSPNSVVIGGYLGEKIDLCIAKRIKTQDIDHLVEPFRHQTENRLWQTEFWGKWMLSAVGAYEYNRDPELHKTIQTAVRKLLETQLPNGYIGNYADSAQLKHWDIWGRKYTILGLLAYYDITGDKTALKASQRIADHLLSQVEPGKENIVKTGNYRGMPSSSILEPMVFLYTRTGEMRYLEFAKYIVAQWETTDGPKLISKALEGIPVAERFPHPTVWWSWENGQKAYEMMSCYEGLLELYKITGNQSYLTAIESAVKNIIDTEINICGSGTAFECWYNGKQKQTIPTYHTMETCVTMTWMKLCSNLLQLTGNSLYADQIEKTTYNALMASMKFDGSQIAKYSPLEGVRQEGEEQCGMHINCCNANGPRAFAMLPRLAYMKRGNELYINTYGESKANIILEGKNKLEIEQVTTYPIADQVELRVNPEISGNFTIAFRIPSWSDETDIKVNGTKVDGIKYGTYYKISRVWNKGDKVNLTLDLRGRLVMLNGNQAIVRGPIVLSRDNRFKDGYVDETAIVQNRNNRIELIPSDKKPDAVWMSFTAPLVLGTDLEGGFRVPRQIHFCDFASAGNSWEHDDRYRVWIRQTLNVMGLDYSTY